MHFGEILRAEYEKLGWTRKRLADYLGVGEMTIARWEKGEAVPVHRLGFKLAELFGVSLKDLGLLDILDAISVETRQQEAVSQVAQADSSNIQEVAASQLAIINSYYQSGLSQSQQSFRCHLSLPV